MESHKHPVIVSPDPECPTILWPRGEQIQSELAILGQIRPVEIHVKPDGSTSDEPSLCFVMETQAPGVHVYAQITLAKLWPAIEAAIKARGPLS